MLRAVLLFAIVATFGAAAWLAASAPDVNDLGRAQAAQTALCLGSGMGCGARDR